MEKAVMEQYRHLFNCESRVLPTEAEKALKDGSIDSKVVSAIPSLLGRESPSKRDLEESGINFPLKQFLGLSSDYCLHIIGQLQAGIYTPQKYVESYDRD